VLYAVRNGIVQVAARNLSPVPESSAALASPVD